MAGTIRLTVLTAGLSTPSSTRMLADELARSAREQLAHRGAAAEIEVFELREHAHDITDALLTRFPNDRLAAVIESVHRAHAVIAVTPVFNLGPSGLFKTFLDAVNPAVWQDKPVLLGATAGTTRHSLAIDYTIRPLFAYLRAAPTPTAVFAASSDFGADSEEPAGQAPLAERVRRAAAELTAALSTGAGTVHEQPESTERNDGARRPDDRSSPVLDPEFSDFVPMDQLLGPR